ncbi:MAG: hypothetical protein SGI90_10500 [Candidatus Eisenbacteria bacterium]|nr:hypothetical protein [Candidatus Eisenbacteria bacterium]
MKRITGNITIALLTAIVGMIGCSKSDNPDTVQTASVKPGASVKPAPSVKPVRETPKPRTETMVIPAGTNILASLETRLSSDVNHAGDQFRARTVEPIIVDGKTVVSTGATVRGVLSDVQDSGKIKGRARMTLNFEQIEDVRGQMHRISAQSLTLKADSNTRGDVEKIAGGGVLGAIIGGIAGGKKGALIGAGAGAGVGTVIVLTTKGDDLVLEPGQKLNLHTTSSTSIVLVAQR